MTTTEEILIALAVAGGIYFLAKQNESAQSPSGLGNLYVPGQNTAGNTSPVIGSITQGTAPQTTPALNSVQGQGSTVANDFQQTSAALIGFL